jgi:hypothetical protein
MRSYARFQSKARRPVGQLDGHSALQRRDAILIKPRPKSRHTSASKKFGVLFPLGKRLEKRQSFNSFTHQAVV